ncbi:T9SS type A sorting domain-containing protein [Mesonia sp.]|uniref:T9SS type A sorting domain-containing protein n=1 Tax=Mesonia sp. TaxID=1960830 RepID=UPI001762886C|nr:T9SS type A sorting domain-containing protein [Mesonia sp.]HIB36262.1 T9SS type A sorting domain-containing protein [Mesonia sp.]HIO27675.1 T9SS type A sorting domain-containing protein [Flavobacteriaceae bacterium]
MKNSTSIQNWMGIIFLLFYFTTQAQTYQNANTQANNNYSIPYLTLERVENASNAVDGTNQGNLATFATVKANSGLLGGIGDYNGVIRLQYPNTVIANTTTYIRIDSNQDDLLDNLLGGSEIADLLGSLILGNQIITIDALNGTTNVFSASSDDDFNDEQIRLVANSSGEYFIAVTPPSNYNRIRITHNFNSLLGLTDEAELDVYGAYYNTSTNTCEGANYTSWKGDGGLLNLDLTGTAGVNFPDHVIDSNFSNYSELVLPTVTTAGSIQQTVYFDGALDETYQIRLSSTADVLNLNLADNIQIIGYNGTTQVSSVSLSTLLDLDLLGLFQSNEIITFPFTPGAAIDRVTVRVSSLANVSLTSSLRLYSVTRNSIGLETETATNIDTDGATLNASITNSDCLDGTYGFEYSTDPNFAQGAGTQVTATNLSGGNYSYDLTELDANKTYYFRAYAVADAGGTTYNVYGDLESFTTEIITWDGTSWNNVDGPDPDGSDDALIDGNYTSNEDGGDIAVDSLFISTGVILSLANNDNISIYGNIAAADDHSIDAEEGSLTWLGGESQVLNGNDFVNNSINIVEVNKTANTILEAYNEINIIDNFTITSGDLNLNENSNLVFKSSATKTAIFGQVLDCANTTINYLGSGSTQGKVTVERFIFAKRAFRGLTAPVNSTTSINENWQEGASNNVPDYTQNQNPVPGYGTHITGTNTLSSGFDITATTNPSLFTYDNDSQSWITFTNTSASYFSVGYPYFILVRGDRSINTQYNAPPATNTILRSSGQLHLCDYSFTSDLSSTANNFNLIGNPYQSPVDMNLVLAGSTNINTAVYQVYDAHLNDNGAYTVIDVSDGSSVPPSSANQYLQPGQAAFVYNDADGGTASITFEESHKFTLATNDAVFRGVNNNTAQSIRINLYKNSTELIDGVKLNLGDNYSFDIDMRDVLKSINFDETLGLVNNTEVYAIVSEPAPEVNKTYPLDLSNYRANYYRFQIELNNIQDLNIALKDNFLNTTTAIDQNIMSYDFEINLNDNSSLANRFELIITTDNLNSESYEKSKFSIYPNPVTDNNFSISSSTLDGEKVQVTVHSILGNQVYVNDFKVNNGSLNIQLNENFNTGIYIVNLKTETNTYTQKLIVK